MRPTQYQLFVAIHALAVAACLCVMVLMDGSMLVIPYMRGHRRPKISQPPHSDDGVAVCENNLRKTEKMERKARHIGNQRLANSVLHNNTE